jgi:hypothetical protein
VGLDPKIFLMVIMTEQQTSAVAEAERIVADLEARRRALIERKQEMEETRRRLSYGAVAEKDPAAIKALAALALEANRHAHDMDALMAASMEADQRLIAARQHEAETKDRVDALALRDALREFVECGLAIDEALTAIAEEGHAMREALNRIHILGSPTPSHEQVNALGVNAVLTALMATPWKREFRTLAPRERRNMASLVRAWASHLPCGARPPWPGWRRRRSRQPPRSGSARRC